MAREAAVRAADVCVTLLDRLNGDQVSSLTFKGNGYFNNCIVYRGYMYIGAGYLVRMELKK